jgi:hypothetical protein
LPGKKSAIVYAKTYTVAPIPPLHNHTCTCHRQTSHGNSHIQELQHSTVQLSSKLYLVLDPSQLPPLRRCWWHLSHWEQNKLSHRCPTSCPPWKTQHWPLHHLTISSKEQSGCSRRQSHLCCKLEEGGAVGMVEGR